MLTLIVNMQVNHADPVSLGTEGQLHDTPGQSSQDLDSDANVSNKAYQIMPWHNNNYHSAMLMMRTLCCNDNYRMVRD